MNKTKQSLLAIVVGLTLAAGVSYGWIVPTANPPGGNTKAPILELYTGTQEQKKLGLLTVSGLTDLLDTVLKGNVSVGTAAENKKLDVQGILKVIAGVSNYAIVTDGSGNVAIGKGTTTAGGKLDVAGNIKTGSLTSTGLITTPNLTVSGTLKIPNGACKGYYLVSDANGVASWKQPNGNKVYNSPGYYTFVVPPCVTEVTVSMSGGGCGGGGGGSGWGDNDNYYGGGGGGGGGGIDSIKIKVTPGSSISLRVGAGGDGGVGGAARGKEEGRQGQDGIQSVFKGVTATGGKGGSGGDSGYTATGGNPGGQNGIHGFASGRGGNGGDSGAGWGQGGYGAVTYYGEDGEDGGFYGGGAGGGGEGKCIDLLSGNCTKGTGGGNGGATA